MKRNKIVLLGLFLLGTGYIGCIGCAAYQAYPQMQLSGERAELAELEGSLLQAEQELGQLGGGQERPDCDKTCGLSQTICRRASQVCSIAERHPDDDTDIHDKCQDAIQRCGKARVKVSGWCQCPE